MEWEPLQHHCAICGKSYKFGHHMYDEGTHIEQYNMDICQPCYIENEQGWSPSVEKYFLAHLEKNSILIPLRNENGLYPRGCVERVLK